MKFKEWLKINEGGTTSDKLAIHDPNGPHAHPPKTLNGSQPTPTSNPPKHPHNCGRGGTAGPCDSTGGNLAAPQGFAPQSQQKIK